MNDKFRQTIAKGRLDDMASIVRRNFCKVQTKNNAESTELYNADIEKRMNKEITDYFYQILDVIY